jgi:hypothetical protein
MVQTQHMTDDASIQNRIESLIDEERRLRERHGADGLSDDEQQQMEALQLRLDQLWDLLRQRRAREEFGLDPDDATLRDPDTVEEYEQ